MQKNKISLAADLCRGKHPWTARIKSCTAPTELLGDLLSLLMII